MQPPTSYPASLTVDYPEERDRLTTFFRLVTVIPIAIILVLLAGGHSGNNGDSGIQFSNAAPGILFLPVLLMQLFRQKYPRWWFDWNLALSRFALRVEAYFFLLVDQYPSTDEEQSVHAALIYPDAARELNRWLPLVKWFLAIPHLVVLFFLFVAVVVVTFVAWFSILITGRYPRALFDFVVGVFRWSLRVAAYAFILTTDRYPPFSLSE